MVTFDQAFANTKQGTRLSIKTKLQARGYDLEGELDDSFMGLQEKDLEAAGLTPPETTALRHVLAKITGRSAHEDPPGDESTSGREKAAGGVVYVQVILRQAGQPVKVQLASEEEAEAAAPLNGSEVACVSELTLQTLKVPPPPATSAVYVDPGGNSLPVHIRLPATEQEYLALPPQLISDNSRDKPLRLIVCKSGFAMGMVRDIQSAIAAVVQDFTAGIKGMFVAVNTHTLSATECFCFGRHVGTGQHCQLVYQAAQHG